MKLTEVILEKTKMKVLTAPERPTLQYSKTIFLAGSIEQDKAERWQDRVINEFKNYDVLFYNPRRAHWDSSLKQDISCEEFSEQVNWELDMLESCKTIFMYLDPKTQSPISLLEFGKYYASGKLIICCPDGFWRKGNIQICCDREKLPIYNRLEDAITELKKRYEFSKILRV